MAKIQCKCGHIISNGCSPNTVEGYLLSDNDLEDFGMKNACAVINLSQRVWECCVCGRLIIVRKDNTVKWYAPEDRAVGKLFVTQKETQ